MRMQKVWNTHILIVVCMTDLTQSLYFYRLKNFWMPVGCTIMTAVDVVPQAIKYPQKPSLAVKSRLKLQYQFDYLLSKIRQSGT